MPIERSAEQRGGAHSCKLLGRTRLTGQSGHLLSAARGDEMVMIRRTGRAERESALRNRLGMRVRASVVALVALGVVAGVPAVALASVPPSVFWANFNDGTISRASLDGSGGGLVSTSGVPSTSNADGVAIDLASGRIYWANRNQNAINYANLDGSGGGGALNTSGATVSGPSGVAVEIRPAGSIGRTTSAPPSRMPAWTEAAAAAISAPPGQRSLVLRV